MTRHFQNLRLLVSALAIGCDGVTELGNVERQSKPPDSPVVQFAPAPMGMCALHATGDVVCFQAGYPHSARVRDTFGRPMRLSGPGSQGRMCSVGWYGQLSCTEEGLRGPLTHVRWQKKFVDVKVGFFGGCALVEEGSVACWGSLSPNLLLRGDSGPDSLELVALPRPAVQIAVSDAHTCAVLDDGSVYCHGQESYGQVTGQLRDGRELAFVAPTAVPGINDAKQVSLTMDGTCVLHATGKVTCFGAAGSAGLGPTGTPSAYGQPAELEHVTHLNSNRHAVCARVEGDELFCWGISSCGTFDDSEASCEEFASWDRPRRVSHRPSVDVFGLHDSLLCTSDGQLSFCSGWRWDDDLGRAVAEPIAYTVAL